MRSLPPTLRLILAAQRLVALPASARHQLDAADAVLAVKRLPAQTLPAAATALVAATEVALACAHAPALSALNRAVVEACRERLHRWDPEAPAGPAIPGAVLAIMAANARQPLPRWLDMADPERGREDAA